MNEVKQTAGWGLSRPWWKASEGNFDGDVPRLTLDYTMADRVLRLREMAVESLSRGDGPMARLQATAARDYRRQHFAASQPGPGSGRGEAA